MPLYESEKLRDRQVYLRYRYSTMINNFILVFCPDLVICNFLAKPVLLFYNMSCTH